MENSDYIAIAGIVATLLGVLITWMVMKKQYASKKLSYLYDIEPIIISNKLDLPEIKVTYQGQELSHPMLLNLNLVNTGLSAIEDAEVIIRVKNATYFLPGYLAEIPAGYDAHWSVDSTALGICKIKFKHINPKQTAKVRVLISEEITSEDIEISCPMANVEFVQGGALKLNAFAEIVIQVTAPQLHETINRINRL